MAHTHGPWKWRECGRGNDYELLDGDGHYILHSKWGESDLPKEAMQLITAAADLLAAAKLTSLHFRRMSASGNFMGDDEHEAWGSLDAAIAKAEKPLT